MIYQFIKLVVALSLRIFFKRFVVNKNYDLPTSGPLIIVGNHPNTLMDPYILATLFKQKVGFLGNASLFVNKAVSTFFRYFQVIPVYRPQDVGPGIKPDNSKTFAACYKHLENGKAIMIFPEGTSFGELKLRKIKTGTARIALGVQEKNDFRLDLKIIPIGLYYSSPSRFRSKVYVNVGEMITTQNWKEPFADDDVFAVQELTKQIKTSLEQLVIHTRDQEQEDLFHKIKRIYKSRLLDTYNLEKDRQEEFRLTQEISKAIQYFQAIFPVKFQKLKNKIEECDQLMSQLKTSSKISGFSLNLPPILRVVLNVLYIIVGFPIYIYGYLHNFLPFRIPRWAAQKITKEVEYHAPISMTIGIFLFPICYGAYAFTFSNYFFNHWLIIFLYIISLPLSGYYALHYYHLLKRSKEFLNDYLTSGSKKEMMEQLKSLKKEITQELDNASVEYLNRL